MTCGKHRRSVAKMQNEQSPNNISLSVISFKGRSGTSIILFPPLPNQTDNAERYHGQWYRTPSRDQERSTRTHSPIHSPQNVVSQGNQGTFSPIIQPEARLKETLHSVSITSQPNPLPPTFVLHLHKAWRHFPLFKHINPIPSQLPQQNICLEDQGSLTGPSQLWHQNSGIPSFRRFTSSYPWLLLGSKSVHF